MIHAASASTASFQEASSNLQALAEADVSPKRIGRLVTRIGNERIAEVQRQSRQYKDLPIPLRTQSPVEITPELVCVQVDGGRLQIRDRSSAANQARGPSDTFWRESKVGSLLKMTGSTYQQDPCPEIPTVFVDPQRIRRLVGEIKGFSGDCAEAAASPSDPARHADEPYLSSDDLHESTRPQPLVRSVFATAESIGEFGNRLVGQAYRRGFMAASRKAFVCDGMACNWTLHQKHFSRFTPILDFVHAICYIYHAAVGGQPSVEAWERYCRWAQLTWAGDTETLLKEMEARQQQIGQPDNDHETDPRQLLADGIRYVTNQAQRMQYAEYRRQGLPITTAYIESTIKQVNRRVKGTEKFWSLNANPILQLRADALSETRELEKFWQRRPNQLTAFTHYNIAG